MSRVKLKDAENLLDKLAARVAMWQRTVEHLSGFDEDPEGKEINDKFRDALGRLDTWQKATAATGWVPPVQVALRRRGAPTTKHIWTGGDRAVLTSAAQARWHGKFTNADIFEVVFMDDKGDVRAKHAEIGMVTIKACYLAPVPN